MQNTQNGTWGFKQNTKKDDTIFLVILLQKFNFKTKINSLVYNREFAEKILDSVNT